MPRTPKRVLLYLGAAAVATGSAGAGELGSVAFPSLAPRGWDIYFDDGTGERPLTNDPALEFNAAFSPDGTEVAYVKSVSGNLDLFVRQAGVDRAGAGRRLTRHLAMDDHPTWSPSGDRIAFASTREPNGPGKAWTAVYTIGSDGRDVARLSPDGASDYSPAWSPAGDWIALASGSGAPGGTDLYLVRPDGSGRRLLVRDGGWPAFVDAGRAVAFHRQGDDGGWGVWRVAADGTGLELLAAGASMPAASRDGKRLAFVDHGPDTKQVHVLDLGTGARTALTNRPTDHWNPALSPDGKSVAYHRVDPGARGLNVERWDNPAGVPADLLRVAGGFPVFSPDRQWIAVTGASFSRLDVMRPDGRDRRTVFEGARRTLFGLSWLTAPSRLAFSQGTAFGPPVAEVKLVTIDPNDPNDPDQAPEVLVDRPGNSAFPSASPDGHRIVFRAESGGYKNLFVLDRGNGAVTQLTRGEWTDTMPHWSPTGEWIAFSSTRDRDFEVWIVRPDGTGLSKLVGGGGRNTHPQFSPDGGWIVFATQRAGYSAEAVSLPGMPQPYGDLFAIRLDGTGLTRLTHNAFEEGTPVWSSLTTVEPSDAPAPDDGEF